MKILALLPSFYGSTGHAVNERQLMLALSKKVDKCFVIAFPSIREGLTLFRKRQINLPKNMSLLNIPIPHRFFITTFAKILVSYAISTFLLISRLHKKIELIYIRDPALAIGFLFFRPLTRKTVIKITGFIEDVVRGKTFIHFIDRKLNILLDKLVLTRANKIAVGSIPFYYKLVQRRKVKARSKPLLMPAGIDLSTIQKIEKHKIEPRKEKFFKVGYIGSLYWWQGVDLLVYAIGIVRKEVNNVKLVIIGNGPLKGEIEQLCRKLKLNHHITGYLPHENALKLLRQLDVMVLPRRKTSTTETVIPIKILEALALGVPVVATRHKVFIKSGFKDREHLIYCEPYPSDIAKAILLIFENEEIRRKLSQNGPKIAKEFSYDKIVQQLLKSTGN